LIYLKISTLLDKRKLLTGLNLQPTVKQDYYR